MLARADRSADALEALQGLFEGEFSDDNIGCIAAGLSEDPAIEDELMGQVAVHNLLCKYFHDEREDRGLRTLERAPEPLEMSIIRVDCPATGNRNRTRRLGSRF